VTTATVVVGLAAAPGTHTAVLMVLAQAGITVSLGDPGVLRAVVGAALDLALVGLLGTGLGWLLRSTAGALSALLGILFVLPVVGLLAPSVVPYLPGNAGAAILQVGPAAGLLAPWTGLTVFAGYAVLTLAAAAVVLRRRDA
jgi:hypothetical protein